jgi:hypothetical protein
MNAPFVQKSSVAAAKIGQPNFADVLQMRAGATLWDILARFVLTVVGQSEQLPLIG